MLIKVAVVAVVAVVAIVVADVVWGIAAVVTVHSGLATAAQSLVRKPCHGS